MGDLNSGVGAFSVTPNDSTNFSQVARFLWVGNAGTVTLVTMKDETVQFANVNGHLMVACKRVNATGTNATSIVGIY